MFGQPRDRLLIYDTHRPQTTEKVKNILTQECQTTLGLVPPGATSKVQPLDVTFTAEFKKSVLFNIVHYSALTRPVTFKLKLLEH